MKIKYTTPEFQIEFDPDTEVYCPCCGNVETKPAGYDPLKSIAICKMPNPANRNGMCWTAMFPIEEAFSLAEDYPFFRERFDVNELNDWYERTMVKACCAIIGDPDLPATK